MSTRTEINKADILQLLSTIPDPEIPAISIVELGVVREVNIDGSNVEIVITPTYTGCPAMEMIETDIGRLLKENGYENTTITTSISPPWTTDWIGEEAREKLRAYGIAPPVGTTMDKSSLTGNPKVVACPQCRSENTVLTSQFGSTPCKSLYKCNDCLEPFDYFKCI